MSSLFTRSFHANGHFEEHESKLSSHFCLWRNLYRQTGDCHPNEALTHSPTEWILGVEFQEQPQHNELNSFSTRKPFFWINILGKQHLHMWTHVKTKIWSNSPLCGLFVLLFHIETMLSVNLFRSVFCLTATYFCLRMRVCAFHVYFFRFRLSSQSWGEIAAIAIWFGRSSHTHTHTHSIVSCALYGVETPSNQSYIIRFIYFILLRDIECRYRYYDAPHIIRCWGWVSDTLPKIIKFGKMLIVHYYFSVHGVVHRQIPCHRNIRSDAIIFYIWKSVNTSTSHKSHFNRS